MIINLIEERIKNRIPKPMDIIYNYGILVPLIKIKNDWKLIYQVRAKSLERQPGEVCFPGGAVEGKESFKETAIRETCEELNIKEDNIKILGQLDYLISHSNSSMYPFLGIIKDVHIDKIKYNKEEVDHIFTVPFQFFLENQPNVYYIDLKTVTGEDFPYEMVPNGEDYNWDRGKHSVYFYEYENYIIWGLTAKITKNFIDIIKKS